MIPAKSCIKKNDFQVDHGFSPTNFSWQMLVGESFLLPEMADSKFGGDFFLHPWSLM